MTTTQPESLRIPINREQRRRFERAAQVRGQTLDEFALAVLEAATGLILREDEGERPIPLVLSSRDSLAFAQAIVAPPEPSPTFLEAAREHRRRVEER